MLKNEFTPIKGIDNILSNWWIVLLFTTLGGVTGYLFHLFNPPIYEATSHLTISMFFEKRELTQYEQDHAFLAAGAVITSSDVINSVKKIMVADELTSEEIDRLLGNVSTEYRESIWDLHVRDKNPVFTARYANVWAYIAEQRLNEALKHSLMTAQLQTQVDSLQNCLPSSTDLTVTVPVACKSFSLDDINSKIQEWSNELATEQALSLGILPIMTITLSQTASVPLDPVLYGRASVVMAGACIGFVLSLWLTGSRKGHRRDKNLQTPELDII